MKKKFRLEGLDCPSCASKMEEAINKLGDVEKATVNFMTSKLTIEGENEKMSSILQEAEKIIKKIDPNVQIKKA